MTKMRERGGGERVRERDRTHRQGSFDAIYVCVHTHQTC